MCIHSGNYSEFVHIWPYH